MDIMKEANSCTAPRKIITTRHAADEWYVIGWFYESNIVITMNAIWKTMSSKAKIIEFILNCFTFIPEYRRKIKSPELNTRYKTLFPNTDKAGNTELHRQFITHYLNNYPSVKIYIFFCDFVFILVQ